MDDILMRGWEEKRHPIGGNIGDEPYLECDDTSSILHEEFSSISEQRYSNTSKAYWHGSYRRDLKYLLAYSHGDEKVPLAWVSNSIAYAEQFAIPREDGALYHLRQLKILNIWNPLADKDWSALITRFPEYNVGNTRNALATYDWISLVVRAGKMWTFKRGDLLEAIQSLKNYDGVFNRESWNGSPCIGIFPKSTKSFGIVNRYEWDENKKLWRDVDQPNRAYNPKTKKLLALHEGETDRGSSKEDNNERQNFVEGYI